MILIKKRAIKTLRGGVVEWGTHVPNDNSSIIASTHGNSWVDGMDIENKSLHNPTKVQNFASNTGTATQTKSILTIKMILRDQVQVHQKHEVAPHLLIVSSKGMNQTTI